jgi:hypothetical protein
VRALREARWAGAEWARARLALFVALFHTQRRGRAGRTPQGSAILSVRRWRAYAARGTGDPDDNRIRPGRPSGAGGCALASAPTRDSPRGRPRRSICSATSSAPAESWALRCPVPSIACLTSPCSWQTLHGPEGSEPHTMALCRHWPLKLRRSSAYSVIKPAKDGVPS